GAARCPRASRSGSFRAIRWTTRPLEGAPAPRCPAIREAPPAPATGTRSIPAPPNTRLGSGRVAPDRPWGTCTIPLFSAFSCSEFSGNAALAVGGAIEQPFGSPMTSKPLRLAILNAMAGADIEASLDRQASWGIRDLDLKDSLW